MINKLIITEQDLTSICNGIFQMASTKDSGQTFEYCYDKEDISLIMDVTYTFEAREVHGGSFEYFNGQIEYERYYDVVNEHYTIESLSAFCEEEEIQVLEDLERRLTEMLNN